MLIEANVARLQEDHDAVLVGWTGGLGDPDGGEGVSILMVIFVAVEIFLVLDIIASLICAFLRVPFKKIYSLPGGGIYALFFGRRG